MRSNNTQFVDYYKILEVSSKATPEDIRKAKNRLVLSWHPDKVDEATKEMAQQKFQAIMEAFDVLFDQKKRAEYDKLRNQHHAEELFLDKIKQILNTYHNKLNTELKKINNSSIHIDFNDVEQRFEITSTFKAEANQRNYKISLKYDYLPAQHGFVFRPTEPDAKNEAEIIDEENSILRHAIQIINAIKYNVILELKHSTDKVDFLCNSDFNAWNERSNTEEKPSKTYQARFMNSTHDNNKVIAIIFNHDERYHVSYLFNPETKRFTRHDCSGLAIPSFLNNNIEINHGVSLLENAKELIQNVLRYKKTISDTIVWAKIEYKNIENHLIENDRHTYEKFSKIVGGKQLKLTVQGIKDYLKKINEFGQLKIFHEIKELLTHENNKNSPYLDEASLHQIGLLILIQAFRVHSELEKNKTQFIEHTTRFFKSSVTKEQKETIDITQGEMAEKIAGIKLLIDQISLFALTNFSDAVKLGRR